MNRTDRLLGILLELQARGGVRAEDLAQTFEVSVRTVYRDVQALCETGVPVVATPGKGYRLLDGYFLPPLSFTADEAALLVLGGGFVRERVDAGLRRAADEALRKLRGILPPDRRAETEQRRKALAFATMTPAVADDPRLALARRAIDERRVARLLYHTYRRPAPELRDVEPVRLIHLNDGWYLAAYCRLRQAPRVFRLDRVDRLAVLEERFVLDVRHHDPPHPPMRLGGYPEARVRFEPSVVRWVRERQSFTLLREEPTPGRTRAGPVFVYAIRDERELIGWLLQWGRSVEVLEPASLRERLTEEARAILACHGEPPRRAASEPRRAESRSTSSDKCSGSASAPDRQLSGARA
ncbi:MAG: YafY family transcriptional regulator [Chloroflexi bacterium]|nr:YafY family transcriptional regulator [Chloroflexota bacterium]